MSYSDDRSSGGGVAGMAGVGSVLLICLLVGLKVASRTVGRNLSRQSWSSDSDPPPGDPNFYSREGARQTSIGATPVPESPSYPPAPVTPATGNAGGDGTTLESSSWQEGIDLFRRYQQETMAEMKSLYERYHPKPIPLDELKQFERNFLKKTEEAQDKLTKLELKLGPAPPDVLRKMGDHPEFDAFMRWWQKEVVADVLASGRTGQSQPFPIPNPQPPIQPSATPVLPTTEDDRARRETALADAELDRQRRENALAEADRQRAAEAERERRDRAAMVPGQPGPQQPGGNNDAPPGFTVTAVDQVKPKQEVFVRDQSGWIQAVVLHRRGAEVTVRSTVNGTVGRVAVGNIRLQTDPAADVAASAGAPAALRPVAGTRDPANKPEAADDTLIVAKPRKEEAPAEQPAEATTPAAGPAASAPISTMRTWSNSTGEFKVDAELVGFEFDLVQLKKRDGKVISINIEILSAADQAVVRDRYK